MSAHQEPIAPLPFATSYRTHTCGELLSGHAGQKVRLCGQVQAITDGGKAFELRDGFGATRVVLMPAAQAMLQGEGFGPKGPPPETVVGVAGVVKAGGEGEPPVVEAETFEPISFAKPNILFDFLDPKLPASERLRHRYIYLRNPQVHANFAWRTQLVANLRRYLIDDHFEEVETPLLATRWSPEAASSYLAIRNPGQIFALPGERPLHPPVLMASGYDRTFEFARRFLRQKAYGPFEQAEYTALELMLAFVGAADLTAVVNAFFAELWQQALGARPRGQITRIAHADAMVRYGTASPDLRAGLPFEDVTDVAATAQSGALRELTEAAGVVRALRVPGGAARVDGAALARATETAATFTLHWVTVDDGKLKLGGTRTGLVDDQFAGTIFDRLKPGSGDLLLLLTAREEHSAARATIALRAELARLLNLIEPERHALVLVDQLPYFEYDASANGYALRGDPLALPVDEELDGDREKLRSNALVVSLDGHPVCSGAVRNHDEHLQLRLFAALGLSGGEIDARYGRLLGSFRYGVAPHARISVHLDRALALLRGLPGIDELIPLPKSPEGTDTLARAPWPIAADVLRSLLAV